MKTFAHVWQAPNIESRRAIGIKSTLYDLIEAISDEVERGEDDLITASVLDLIESRRIKFVMN